MARPGPTCDLCQGTHACPTCEGRGDTSYFEACETCSGVGACPNCRQANGGEIAAAAMFGATAVMSAVLLLGAVRHDHSSQPDKRTFGHRQRPLIWTAN